MQTKQKKVVVGLSGGVDSSVVALLLKLQNFDVVGLHMKTENITTQAEDEQRVRDICKKIGIDCHFVEYDDQMQIVKDYFVKEYLDGRTPNPCVVCNREVKFKPFIDYAKKIDADYFATGHYAQIEHNNGLHYLKTAVDDKKDQSYFLCQLSQSQFEKALFPLGSFTKDEVRKIAKENGFDFDNIKESQDICFLGSQKFKDFMAENYPEKPGNIIDEKTNQIVGKHNGISKYTIGQRKGLGIGGGFGETGECWFVSKKDVKNNIIYVAQGNNDILYSDALICNNFNWIPKKPNDSEFECVAKFRYRQSAQKVKVVIINENSIRVEFAEKQKAVTVGQYVVLYEGENCLGGGTIDEIIKL